MCTCSRPDCPSDVTTPPHRTFSTCMSPPGRNEQCPPLPCSRPTSLGAQRMESIPFSPYPQLIFKHSHARGHWRALGWDGRLGTEHGCVANGLEEEEDNQQYCRAALSPEDIILRSPWLLSFSKITHSIPPACQHPFTHSANTWPSQGKYCGRHGLKHLIEQCGPSTCHVLGTAQGTS